MRILWLYLHRVVSLRLCCDLLQTWVLNWLRNRRQSSVCLIVIWLGWLCHARVISRCLTRDICWFLCHNRQHVTNNLILFHFYQRLSLVEQLPWKFLLWHGRWLWPPATVFILRIAPRCILQALSRLATIPADTLLWLLVGLLRYNCLFLCFWLPHTFFFFRSLFNNFFVGSLCFFCFLNS